MLCESTRGCGSAERCHYSRPSGIAKLGSRARPALCATFGTWAGLQLCIEKKGEATEMEKIPHPRSLKERTVQVFYFQNQ